jgi:hypothetical protein
MEACRILSMLMNWVRGVLYSRWLCCRCYAIQLPQVIHTITTKMHVHLLDGKIVNVQCHFPPHISKGLPLCSFVCGVKNHYKVWEYRIHPTATQLHYILCSSLLGQNYFHVARGNELTTLMWFIFLGLTNEYNINTNKCTTRFWCSLIRQIYNIQLNHICAWPLSFPVLDAWLQLGLVNHTVHTVALLLGACTTNYCSIFLIHSYYSINIRAKIFNMYVFTIITCTFYAHHPLNHGTPHSNF